MDSSSPVVANPRLNVGTNMTGYKVELGHLKENFQKLAKLTDAGSNKISELEDKISYLEDRLSSVLSKIGKMEADGAEKPPISTGTSVDSVSSSKLDELELSVKKYIKTTDEKLGLIFKHVGVFDANSLTKSEIAEKLEELGPITHNLDIISTGYDHLKSQFIELREASNETSSLVSIALAENKALKMQVLESLLAMKSKIESMEGSVDTLREEISKSKQKSTVKDETKQKTVVDDIDGGDSSAKNTLDDSAARKSKSTGLDASSDSTVSVDDDTLNSKSKVDEEASKKSKSKGADETEDAPKSKSKSTDEKADSSKSKTSKAADETVDAPKTKSKGSKPK
jgi:CII-binding regulator of phage lambda lysogenization HflD